MYCPKCAMPRPNDPTFCSECGSALIAPPKPKKGKLWPPILFLAVMFTVGCVVFALTWSADGDDPPAAPWFSIEDGTLYFDPSLYTGSGDLVAPETLNGQKVTALADSCFYDCDVITSVTLPETLTAIGDNAFTDCDGLRGIKLPESVTVIGDDAFYSCGSLEAIYIPGSVRTVGSDAFSHCGQLRHIFFVGDRSDWNQLYPQVLSPETTVYSVSGPDADSFSPI